MIGIPTARVLQSSFSKDAVLATTYEDDYITRGMGFQIKKRIILTAQQTLYIEFDITQHSGTVYSLPLEVSTAGGLVLMDTYGADSSTGGIILATPLNLNGLSTNTADSTIKTGVTVSGTTINVREYVVGTLSTNQSSGGGQAQEHVPKILNNTKPIYIKLVNQETDPVTINLGIIWYELPAFT